MEIDRINYLRARFVCRIVMYWVVLYWIRLYNFNTILCLILNCISIVLNYTMFSSHCIVLIKNFAKIKKSILKLLMSNRIKLTHNLGMNYCTHINFLSYENPQKELRTEA